MSAWFNVMDAPATPAASRMPVGGEPIAPLDIGAAAAAPGAAVSDTVGDATALLLAWDIMPLDAGDLSQGEPLATRLKWRNRTGAPHGTVLARRGLGTPPRPTGRLAVAVVRDRRFRGLSCLGMASAMQAESVGGATLNIVIGLGNAYRRDDGVGLVVIRHLQAKGLPHVLAIAASDGMAILEACRDADTVIVVDAVASGVAPGMIMRCDALMEALPRQWFHCSTHTLGVVEAIELARTLNQLPRRLLVYGVTGQHFGPGIGLSPAVEKAVPEVVERIMQEFA